MKGWILGDEIFGPGNRQRPKIANRMVEIPDSWTNVQCLLRKGLKLLKLWRLAVRFSRKLLRSFFCSQRTAAKLKLSLHLHSISYIFLHHLHHLHQLHLDHIHHLHNLHQLQWTSSTLHTSSTSPTSTSSTWHTSIYIINIIYRCSATTYFLQGSHNVIYTGAITRVFTQELLHRTWYTGVLWQSCDTGVVTQE